MSIHPPLCRRLIACVLICTVLGLATGCGQKGDLYLPDASPEQPKKKGR